jgi:hypothetical protein
MRHSGVYFILCTLLAAAAGNDVRATAQSVDHGWPRVFKKDGKQLTVYQPQVDYRASQTIKAGVEYKKLTATQHPHSYE